MESSCRELSNEFCFFGFFRVLVDLLRFLKVLWKKKDFYEFFDDRPTAAPLDDMAAATWQPP